MRKFAYILGIVSWSALFVLSCAKAPVGEGKDPTEPESTTVVRQEPEPQQPKPDKPGEPHQTQPDSPSTPDTTPQAWQEAVTNLEEFEEAFKNKEKYLASNEQINERYKLEDTFKGASGSFIYDVSLRSAPKERRVFKILYEINSPNLWDHFGFKEIYFSKMLSELGKGSTKGALLPPGKTASMFFPHFYAFGFTNSTNPFENPDAGSKKFYPYYVMERIIGLPLQDFALKPELAQKMLGYRIDSAPKSVIFSILFQISLALLNAHLEFEFLHNDIHPKNIFLSTTPLNMTVDAYDTDVKLEGPLVKIIDFDQGEVPAHVPTTWRASKNFGRKLFGKIGEERAFYDAVNPNAPWGSWRGITSKSFSKSPSIDMYIMNILIHTFKDYFLEHGIDVTDQYFTTHTGILNFLRLNAYKLGLAKS